MLKTMIKTSSVRAVKGAAKLLNTKEGKMATASGVVGGVVGSYTGVALLGTAVNGAVVFAPLAAVFAYFYIKKQPNKFATKE